MLYLQDQTIHTHVVLFIIEIDEYSEGTDNCDQVCINTDGSYTCDCDSGHLLQPDGYTCKCGARFNATTGSFQTPGWPNSYPRENIECEWIIQLPNSGATIEFTIDDSAFGTKGRPPCGESSDPMEFFDGTASSATSLEKICGSAGQYASGLPTITTTSSVARVVFTGSDRSRGASRVGVKVDYITIPPLGTYTDSYIMCSCVLYLTSHMQRLTVV